MAKESDLYDRDLRVISQIVRDKVFVPINKRKATIFLCGADIKNKKTYRYKMAALFGKSLKFELLYPEDLFEDLLAGQGTYSLLELENILARSVDAIVLFPESPGSFTELGAFSNNEALAKKMIVLISNKYKSDKSFVNYGPVRLIRKNKSGKVVIFSEVDLEGGLESDVLFKKITKYIREIRLNNPVKKDVTNLLEVEYFILPCIYLIDGVDNVKLYKLVQHAGYDNKLLSEIATKSALGKLIRDRMITRTSGGYKVTPLGASYVQNRFGGVSLDSARVEILNAQNRRNARVRYARVKKGALL